MSKSLEQWLDEDVSQCDHKSIKELSHEYFFRDPARPNYIDNEHFYSPCDGTVLYQKQVTPTEKIVEIKGINYTLQDVMGSKHFDKSSLVIGVFMSFYDPHIIRMPYGGITRYKRLEPIESTNRPMLAVEKDILNAAINPNNLGYLKYNERMVIECYSTSLDYTYYLVLVADEDVDVICPFQSGQNELLAQNQRFGLVRWGSQSEIVLPLDSRYNFEIVQPDEYHIEAGLDKIVKIIYK